MKKIKAICLHDFGVEAGTLIKDYGKRKEVKCAKCNKRKFIKLTK